METPVLYHIQPAQPVGQSVPSLNCCRALVHAKFRTLFVLTEFHKVPVSPFLQPLVPPRQMAALLLSASSTHPQLDIICKFDKQEFRVTDTSMKWSVTQERPLRNSQLLSLEVEHESLTSRLIIQPLFHTSKAQHLNVDVAAKFTRLLWKALLKSRYTPSSAHPSSIGLVILSQTIILKPRVCSLLLAFPIPPSILNYLTITTAKATMMITELIVSLVLTTSGIN